MRINRFVHNSFGFTVLHLCSFLLAVLVLSDLGFAKMDEEPKGFSLQETSLEQVKQEVLPKVDVERLLAEDRAREKNLQRSEPPRFALVTEVNFTLDKSGITQELPDGRLWRLRIHSPNAKSHNLGITRFDMPDGAKLWIYDPAHTHVEGPYTSRHRSHRGSLWTPIIDGDEIVVEVFMPVGVRQPVIEIRKVSQGYHSFDQGGFGGTEDPCNIDVICPAGNNWGKQIRAVGAYTYTEGSNSRYCTGTMLNNTAHDFKNYFLTAYHCMVDSTNDDSVVVYWNDQSPTCGTHGPDSHNNNQVGGSNLRAAYAPTDFRLLELTMAPNPSFNVFYAGWDTTGTPPPSTVGIHHPRGDVKAISLSNQMAQSANYPGTLDPHWQIDWDLGTTEQGSSGSCLFNATTGRCIGQLHGGPNPGCINGNTISYYGKFGGSWGGGGTNDTRLSNWLDPPPGTGALSLDGDPHITTTNGVHYDFQAAGEFISLRDPNGLEIQTRQTPIATTFNPGPDPYHGLATCVSLNTAVAARVGTHRISYQPDLTSGVPDPRSLLLRVDGKPTKLSPHGLNLGDGGRLVSTATTGGLEFDFPDGSVLFVTTGWWADQGLWYLNVDLHRPTAIDGTEPGRFSIGGIAGAITPETWLPKLPDGSSMGPMPSPLHERYVDLYQKFADAWRVTDKSSLFDYAPGTSTDTFTLRSWPLENPPCGIPNVKLGGISQVKPAWPISQRIAKQACQLVKDKNARRNCIFDTRVTGNTGFAKTYQLSKHVVANSTRTTLRSNEAPTGIENLVIFTATVARAGTAGKDVPAGSVQFMLDGRKVGKPLRLDQNGQAIWKTTRLQVGKHDVSANYIPSQSSAFLPSISADKMHMVGRD